MSFPDPSSRPRRDAGPPGDVPGLIRELGRRRVLHTLAWYVGGSAAVLQGADVFQEALGLPGGSVRTLAVLAVCGLPVAGVFSWVYDVSGDGGGHRGWMHHAAAAAVLAAALLGAGFWLGRDPDRASAEAVDDALLPSRVAILALDAPGGDPELLAFATYLHERLIEGLSAAGQAVADDNRIRVISRAGTLPFSGGTLTTDSIGRALRVGTLVSGLVEGTGDGVRVRLQLVDATSAEVLATREAGAEAGDAIGLVDAVADSLVRMVRRSLGDVVRERTLRLETGSADAFREFVRSRYWREEFQHALEVGDPERAERALGEADRALARAETLDAGWVEPVAARALLSDYAHRLAVTRGPADARQIFREGLAHAERAVRLSPESPRALAARGALRAQLATSVGPAAPGEAAALLRGAEDDLRRAAATGARPGDPLRRLSEVLAAAGRLEEALAAGRRAYEEDPFLEETSPSLLRLFEYSIRLDRDDEAAGWCREGRSRFPGTPWFEDCRLLLMAWTNAEAPEPDTAWALVSRELRPYPVALRPRLEPRLNALAAAVLARAGLPDSARVVLAGALGRDGGTAGVFAAAAGVHHLLGDRAAALELAGRALEAAGPSAAILAMGPELRGLRGDPGFRALVPAAGR